MDFGLPYDTLATRVVIIQLQLRSNRVSTLSRHLVTPVVPAQ